MNKAWAGCYQGLADTGGASPDPRMPALVPPNGGWRQAAGRPSALPVQDLRAKGGPRAEMRSAETLTVNKGFLKAGHLPTLIAAFLYFDVSFMVWVLLGPLAVQIAADLHLSAAQKGLMVAVPCWPGRCCGW